MQGSPYWPVGKAGTLSQRIQVVLCQSENNVFCR
jgi:hypothetical protein